MKLFEGFVLSGDEAEWHAAGSEGWLSPARWVLTGRRIEAVYSGDTQWVGGEGGLVMVTRRGIDAMGRRVFEAGSGPSWLGGQSRFLRSGVWSLGDRWRWDDSWPRSLLGNPYIWGGPTMQGEVVHPAGLAGLAGAVQCSQGVFSSAFATYLEGIGPGVYIPRREVGGKFELTPVTWDDPVALTFRVFVDGAEK